MLPMDVQTEMPDFSIDLDKLNMDELLFLERITVKAGKHALPPPAGKVGVEIDAQLTPSSVEEADYEEVLAGVVEESKAA